KTLLKELEINKEISFTEEFISKYNFPDYRNIINPKKKEPFGELKLKEYTQVFFDKFDFIRDLSILDLLFNEGPNTENLLY
ncbi:MAG: WbqC family protein, partial [Chlorobi bacterium]|nr:WbqC family protein [Chlorobiota bacterium]